MKSTVTLGAPYRFHFLTFDLGLAFQYSCILSSSTLKVFIVGMRGKNKGKKVTGPLIIKKISKRDKFGNMFALVKGEKSLGNINIIALKRVPKR